MTARPIPLCAAIVLAAALAVAPASAGQIKGWWIGGGAPQDYNFGTEHVDGGGAKSAYIKCKIAAPASYGTISQAVSAAAYRGKRVRLSALIKTQDADRAQLWLRVDGAGQKMLNFYNMDDQPVTGTTDWKRYSVVLDVPDAALGLVYGYFLSGKGAAWADNFQIETVGKEVPVSAALDHPYPDAAVNSDFEQ